MTRSVAAASLPSANATGFSLLEMLVVLALIGLLAAQAMPAYRALLLRVHRQEARAALLDVARAQERHRVLNRAYAPDTALTDPPPSGLGEPATTESGRYGIRLDPAAPPGSFRAWAEARGDQLADRGCAAFALDSLGRRMAIDAQGNAASSCWD